MDRHTARAARVLAALDADAALAELRRRGATASATELRAMRGAWAAAALWALWRTAAARHAAAPATAGARR